ncbi:MAG: hypothetical protein Q8P46_11665 [Hyphomicrobiales bacterium]|nr:hypothetical protein [Hyphomicrobiales bacterium]
MVSELPYPVRFRTRSAKLRIPPRLIRRADLQYLTLMGLYRLTTALLPPDRWAAVADVMHRLRRGLRKRRVMQLRQRFRAVYGHDVGPDTIRSWHRDRENRRERRRLYVVAERWSDRWRPNIRLEGVDGVAAALAQGKGVILWFDDFIDHNVVAKRGLYEAGYRIHYLSSVLHGDSISAFGRRYLNPIQTAVESRYVQERLLLNNTDAGSGNELACTRRMVAILRENGIVGIANILTSGSRVMEIPFGASARLAMPTGPVNLALQRGAALFPVATIETEPLASYSVIIGPRLVPDPAKGKDAALAEAAMQYAERLLPLVKAHPDQWMGWRRNSFSL